jgi:hypothetical protein
MPYSPNDTYESRGGCSLYFLGSIQVLSLLLNCLLRQHLGKTPYFGLLLFPALYILSTAKLGASLWLIGSALLVIFAFLQACLLKIFTSGTEKIQRLYFLELMGGALGVFAWLWLSSALGFVGFALLIVMAALAAGFLLPSKKSLRVLNVVLALGLLIGLSEPQPVFDKRNRYKIVAEHQRIGQAWDPNGHIEIILGKMSALLLFEGGNLRSSIPKFDGDLTNLRQDYDHGNSRFLGGLDVAAPHFLIGKPGYSAALISAVGGQEILAAKAYGAKEICAIDINQSAQIQAAKIFFDYSGHLYDQVQIVQLDGRKFIEQSNRMFDVIQIFSAANASFSSVLGPELMPSSLVTAEALLAYDQHLTTDGILQLTQYSYLKNKSTFQAAFGEDLFSKSRKIVVLKQQSSDFRLTSFLYKKNSWTESDLSRLSKWLEQDQLHKWEFVYHPFHQNLELSDWKPDHPYQKIASTDNRPFSRHEQPLMNLIQYRYLVISLLVFLILQVFVQFFLKSVSFQKKALSFSMGTGFALAQNLIIILMQRCLGNPANGLTVGIASMLLTTGLAGFVFCKTTHAKWHLPKTLLFFSILTGVLSVWMILQEPLLVILLVLLTSYFQSFFFNSLLSKDLSSLAMILLANVLGMSFGLALFHLTFVTWGLMATGMTLAAFYLGTSLALKRI